MQVMSWALDCYDKGILTCQDTEGLSLEWGDYKAVIELISRTARRKGLGDLLAEGEKRAPKRLGRGSEILMNCVKGMAPVIEDPRARIFGSLITLPSEGVDHLHQQLDPDLRDSTGPGVLNQRGVLARQAGEVSGHRRNTDGMQNITLINLRGIVVQLGLSILVELWQRQRN
jgi:hypothetical protein